MLTKYKIIEAVLRVLAKWGLIGETVYYIHGPETLPPPLSRERETEIFLRLEQDDDEARRILITHNLRLVV